MPRSNLSIRLLYGKNAKNYIVSGNWRSLRSQNWLNHSFKLVNEVNIKCQYHYLTLAKDHQDFKDKTCFSLNC